MRASIVIKVRQYGPGTELVLSRLRVEYSPDGGPHGSPWVRISPVGGCAPDPGVVLPVLLLLRQEDGTPVLHTEERDGDLWLPVPERWHGRPLGAWGRTGVSGAYWGHAWTLGPDGHRAGRWCASWHVSMYDRLNEPVEGDPWVLAYWAAVPAAAKAAEAGVRFDVRVETPPAPLEVADIQVHPLSWLLTIGCPGRPIIMAPLPPSPAAIEPPPPPPRFEEEVA